MTMHIDPLSRRRFMAFAAGSPLLSVVGIDVVSLRRLLGGNSRERAKGLALLQQASQEPDLIASPADALDVFDFEPVARKKLPPAHWGSSKRWRSGRPRRESAGRTSGDSRRSARRASRRCLRFCARRSKS
jgi:hypothetical protein